MQLTSQLAESPNNAENFLFDEGRENQVTGSQGVVCHRADQISWPFTVQKSRQSMTRSLWLFHNLLASVKVRSAVSFGAFRARQVEGNAFRVNSFVRTSQMQRRRSRGTATGRERRRRYFLGKFRFTWQVVRTIEREFLIRRTLAAAACSIFTRVVNQRGCATKLASNLPITDTSAELMVVSSCFDMMVDR